MSRWGPNQNSQLQEHLLDMYQTRHLSLAESSSSSSSYVENRVVVTSSYIVLQSVQRRWSRFRAEFSAQKRAFPVVSFTIDSSLNQAASKDAERRFWVTKHARGSDSTSGQPFPWISTKEIRITGQPRSAFDQPKLAQAHPLSH